MSIEFLHQGLTEDGLTDKSLQEFQKYYSTKDNQSTLYNGLVEDDDFDGTFFEFQNKYFPTQVATTSSKPYVAPVTETKEKSEKDLQIEQGVIDGGFTKLTTYDNVGERTAITSDDVWEGEKGTKEHKAWVKKKQKQAVQIREDQQVEKKKDPNYIISNEEAAKLIGDNGESVVNKYPSSGYNERNIHNKWKWDYNSTYKRKQNYSKLLGEYGETVDAPQVVINGVALREGQGYYNGYFYVDSGKRANADDIAKFEEQRAIIKKDSLIKQRIDKELSYISDSNKKLLYANPEAYLNKNKDYAASGVDNFYLNVLNIEQGAIKKDKVVSEETKTETKDVYRYSIKDGYSYKVGTETYTTVVNRVFEDAISKKRYTIDPTTKEKVWQEWEPGTPAAVIEKWDKYQKEKEAWELENPTASWLPDEDMKKMYDDYHRTRTYQNQNDYAEFNNISISNDFEEFVQEKNIEAQKYFEENTSEIIEDIQSEVQAEFQNRFTRNADGDIVDKSTNQIVSQDKINSMFKATLKDRIASDPDIIKVKRMNNALYANAVESFKDKWKPTYGLIGRDILDKYGSEFEKMISDDTTGDEKKGIVNRLWIALSQKLSDQFNIDGTNDQFTKGDYMDQRKHEFFSYFYNEDAFGLQFDNEGKLTDYTQSLILDTMKTHQYSIAQSAYESGDLNVNTIEQVNEIIDEIVKIQEQNILKTEDVDSFKEGFASLESHEYIPFVSGIIDMMDSYDMMKLAKKAEEAEKGGPPLSAQEKDILTLHQLKGFSDQRIQDISSSWYGGGKLTAQMLPYVAEFIATSGAYSAGRTAVQKGIVKKFKKEAIQNIDDLALKALLKKSKGKIDDAVASYYIKNIGLSNSAKGFSWIAGTVAQTSVNPQRYMKETYENMTPEMQLMMSPEGDELITAITGEGQGFAEAFARGFGVTWAEFSTERLGEAIPMLGKYLGKHNPHAKEWLQSTIVAKYMQKFKLSKPQMMKKIQDGMGWNGFIGEMFEEIVNQPLSNLISGIGTEGFTAGKVFEGMDQRFLEELSISMGSTQLAFGGLSMLGGRIKNKFDYSIEENGTVLNYDKAGFDKRIKELEKQKLFNDPTYKINIDVNNDVEAFKETEKLLGKYKNRNNKTNYVEKNWFDLGLASEVELTEAIASGKYGGSTRENQNDYNNLNTIEEAINEKRQQREDLYKSGLSGKKLANALKENQKELKNLEQSKMDIVNPYLESIEKDKRFSAYKKVTKNIEELSKKMKFDTKLNEFNTLQQTKKAILKDVQRQITELESLDILTNSQQQTLAELQGDLTEGSDLQKGLDENPHGIISKDGKNIFINKSSALAKNGGNINVAAHEFLHRAFKTMLDDSPHTQMALGKALHRHVMAIDPMQYAGDFNKRLQAYQEGNVQTEMDQLTQDYMVYQQQPQTKSTKAELKKIEDRYFKLQNEFTGNMGEEALTLLSDAMLYGNVNMSNQNLSALGKIIERILGAIGLKATFKTGEDVYDFISEFSNSIQKGEVSRKLRKQLSKKAELKGELKKDQIIESKKRNINKITSNQFSKAENKTEQELGSATNTAKIIARNEKLQQDILDRYERGETSLDKNGKIIVPEDIQMELIDNNLPRVTALAAQAANAGKNIELEQDKRKGFDQFFPEYYIKLADLARTYNAEKVPFGAYMNTLLPLKYAGILEDLKKGEIEGAVGLEKAADVAVENENIERAGNLIKLYERFGRYAEVYNLKVKESIKDGKFNPAQENISRVGVNTVDAFPDMTQTMFGVIPKPGNLTRGDVSESQMFINKHPETLISMLPQAAYVVESINPKTGKPSKIKSIGIPRKVLNAFYNKGKRIGNDYAWTLKSNISTSDMLGFAGITERGKPNTYKKDTNTSQSIKGLIDVTGRMMTNQGSREYFLENNMPLENMGTLQESMSSNLFSKRANEASYGDRAIFLAALPRIGEHYVTHGRNLQKSFNEILPGWWKEGREQVIKEIEEHIALYEEYETGAILAEAIPTSLENYITEQTMQLSFENNLRDVMNLPKGQLDFNNKKQLEDVRKAIAKIVYEGNISWQEAKRFLPFLYSTGKTGGTSLRMVEGKGLVKYEEFYDDKIADVEKQIKKKKAEKKSFKNLTERIEKYKEAKLKQLEPTDHPYGIFESVEAFEKEVLDYKKSKWKKGAQHGIPSNTTQGVGVKLNTPEDITAQEQSAKRNQDFLIKFGNEMNRLMNLETGGISKNDVGMILMSLGNVGMNTPIAAAAKVAYAVEGKKNTTDHIYEHLIPRKIVTLYYANFVLEGTAESQKGMIDLFDDFVVAIIPKEQDKIVNAFGYQKSMPASWFVGANPLQRYFNMRTFGTINLKLIDVKTGEPVTGYEGFQKVHEINGDNHAKQVILNKAMLAGRLIAPARGMSTFDFDETVGVSDNYVIATKEGETQRIPSDQWPFVGAQMVEEGWVMDFTDFNQVTKGRPGPLMQKLKNQIKKYGNENVFILTARAAESAPAIKAYLESEGVNLPIENITGLGNSTGEAKAEWMLKKFSEGYNDMYFVDDALPNVEAVKDVLDQLDIKSNVQIARQNFSKSIRKEFAGIMDNATLDMNRILEQTKGVKAEAVFSAAQAKIRGGKIGRYKVFLPPSAQDFKGLLYHFLGKGRIGEAQIAFFNKALINPFAKAISEINSFKQVLNNKYKVALKEFGVDLKSTVGETNLTEDQAVRVYLWNKAGFEIPGLSKRDLKTLVEHVESNKDLQAFAETIGLASEQEAGYLEPSDYWMVENLQSDILKIANERKRSDFLGEWKQNVDIIFSTANLNKIEAIYGSNFREALEDMLHRMEHGSSRESGKSRIVNTFNNWANQSVGAIMFFNMRSALLQTISSINFINWSDNNPLKAAQAFANQPQFWKDFAMIFNSDMLKQRRAGNQRGINEAELADAVAGAKDIPRAVLNWLLTKGFLPTQIADSFAISSGGATFYRNRFNTYVEQGYSQEEAHDMAFQDFQENSEESQQSSRPDMISQQQASPLGRYILAFKNTPMQYARLIQKAAKDLVKGRGDAKTNMSKIVYYAAVQNLIFNVLQGSIGMLIGDDDEEKDIKKYERTINGMIDSLLGGMGVGGVATVTLKNTIQEWLKQDAKEWNSDHTYTILRFFGLSPTISSKGRKLYSAIQTDKFNREVIKKMSLLDIDNPIYSIAGNLISAATNLPLDRVVKKVDNIDAALTEDLSALQRLALLMGWNTWDLDVDDSDVLAVEDEIKKDKKLKNKEKQKIKKEEKKKEKEIESKAKEEENKKKEDGICIAISKGGTRCKNKAEVNGYCTVHAKVEQGTKEVRCKKIKSDKKRCGMMTKAKSGYCYYHD